jgi:alpha-tubulin suppressor-like RCC1 family protein
VYIWTDNKKVPKVIGNKTNIKQQLQIPKGVPTRLEFFDDKAPKTLRIGMRHSAVITEGGELYMFGSGNWGVLGQGNENDHNYLNPVKVAGFEKRGLKVVDVALGEYHSIALTDDGNVWTWGYGGKDGLMNSWFRQEIGALGHGEQKPHFKPKKVQFFEDEQMKV